MVHLSVTEMNVCGSSATAAADVSINVPPPAAPAWAEAHYDGTSPTGFLQVKVSWPAVSGATDYRILRATSRSNDDAGIRVIAQDHVAGTSVEDIVSAANFAYVYRVQANGPGGLSTASSRDVAVTVGFSDGSGLVIRALDWTQMRTAARALCTSAQINMALCSFTDTTQDGISMPSGIPIRLYHLTELRTAVDAARSAFGLPPISYADPTLQLQQGVTPVRYRQITELREGLK